jgi:hypothetical protein
VARPIPTPLFSGGGAGVSVPGAFADYAEGLVASKTSHRRRQEQSKQDFFNVLLWAGLPISYIRYIYAIKLASKKHAELNARFGCPPFTA